MNKKKNVSPTALALKELRSFGFFAQVVEKWNSHANVRVDLFGCVDIVAIRADFGILGIQATSGSHHAGRRTKSLAEPRLKAWLESGGRFEVWSYVKRARLDKYTKKGAPDMREFWELRREEIRLDHIRIAQPPPVDERWTRERMRSLFAEGKR